MEGCTWSGQVGCRDSLIKEDSRDIYIYIFFPLRIIKTCFIPILFKSLFRYYLFY